MLLGLALGALALGACTATTTTKQAGQPLGGDPELRRQSYACANGVNIIVTYDRRAQTASVGTAAGGPTTMLSQVPSTSGFSYASDTHSLRSYEATDVMYSTTRGGAPTRCRQAAA
jgi:membrane-bound inhibitor of C-type lysozyme